MPTFIVSWEMDIEADNAIEAAETALRILRDPEQRECGVFDVIDENGDVTKIDAVIGENLTEWAE